jgi:hypothetical protein
MLIRGSSTKYIDLSSNVEQRSADMQIGMEQANMYPIDTTPLDDDDELAVGARAIAENCFNGQLNDRQVYRLLETDPGWPAFKLGWEIDGTSEGHAGRDPAS